MAVIGAGVVGCAIAWSLAREGWPVILADPAEPDARRCLRAYFAELDRRSLATA